MEHFRPVRGLGLAASVLIGLTALGNVAEAAVGWFTWSTAGDLWAGTATPADLRNADVANVLVDWPLTLLTLVTIGVFLTWLYNARINAERLSPEAEHRHSRVWVWLGWLVPVVNLWYPKQVVEDIWQAGSPPSRTISKWWTAYLLMWLFDFAYVRFYVNGRLTMDSFLIAATFSTISAVVGILAAVLAVRIVRQISDFQSTPVPSSSD
ncbi:DUF4328 domain-containing protein [Lentzea rhizosphaerae]|uniref:DUF4328 domain-containing protein n=1 Tax=Lentzea rhizosphaerae TaxID=2041025 RepID=A0ABV8BZ67_9PSEU